MLKTMRMIQQAAPIPAIKAGCLTTSEICWDSGFCEFSGSVICPNGSVDERTRERYEIRSMTVTGKQVRLQMYQTQTKREKSQK